MQPCRERLSRLIAGRRTKFVAIGAWLLIALALARSREVRGRPAQRAVELPARRRRVGRGPSRRGGLRVGRRDRRDRRLAIPTGSTGAIAVIERLRDVAAANIQGARSPSPPRYSSDGTAAVAVVPIQAEGEVDILIDAVAELRASSGRASRLDTGEGDGPGRLLRRRARRSRASTRRSLLATVALVFFLLVLIYRSPIFWVLPLAAVLVAEAVVRGLGYLLAEAGIVINGQTGGILLVLVFEREPTMRCSSRRGTGRSYSAPRTSTRPCRSRSFAQALPSSHRPERSSRASVFVRVRQLDLAGADSCDGVARSGRDADLLRGRFSLEDDARLYVPRYGSAPRRERGVWERLGSWIERRHRPVWMGSAPRSPCWRWAL